MRMALDESFPVPRKQVLRSSAVHVTALRMDDHQDGKRAEAGGEAGKVRHLPPSSQSTGFHAGRGDQ